MRPSPRFVVLALFAVTEVGCYTYRPPTSALEVVDATPEHGTHVGHSLYWNEPTEACHSPPRDVVARAQSWGADVLAPHVSFVGPGSSPTHVMCGAEAYSLR